MVSDNSLVSLRKEYGSKHRKSFVDLTYDPRVLAANRSNKGVLEALLRGGFESGKVPVAFEPVKATGSGEVICDELVHGTQFIFKESKLQGFSLCPLSKPDTKAKTTLNFTTDSEGQLCKMVAKSNALPRWKEVVNFQGNDIVSTPNKFVSVIMKRTPLYLVHRTERPTHFNGAVFTRWLTKYCHHIWCLSEISEKGLCDKARGLIRKKGKKCGDPKLLPRAGHEDNSEEDDKEKEHPKLLPQAVVRHIVEFVGMGPPPVVWLEEGDILFWGYLQIVRPRKGD